MVWFLFNFNLYFKVAVSEALIPDTFHVIVPSSFNVAVPVAFVSSFSSDIISTLKLPLFESNNISALNLFVTVISLIFLLIS